MIRPVALILLAGVASLLGGEAHRRTEEGNAEYLKGKNDSALEEYQKAQGIVPDAPQIHYDLGNVLYRQQNWAGAAEAYERALGAAGPDLAPKAAYNLGNALFQDHKYDDAIKAYTRTLKAAPTDADARHNLELALRALKEQQKQPKSSQQQQQNQQKDDKDQKPKQGQGEPKPQDDKGNAPKDDKKKDKQDASQAPKPGGMTQQDAEKLLDRLDDQEKQNMKKQAAKKLQPGDTKREKDW